MRERFTRHARSFLAGALLFVGVSGATGCGNPCGTLADKTCEKVGEEAPLCKEARKRADSAGSDERKTCRRALELFEAATAE